MNLRLLFVLLALALFGASAFAYDWNCETVETAGSVGYHTSIFVESGNSVHISHTDYTNTNLRYCRGSYGSWSCETVESTDQWDGSKGPSSIFVESDGNVHMSHKSTSNGLRYCTGTLGNWTCEDVNAAVYGGSYNSIALGSDGTVHISDQYYHKVGSAWRYKLRYCRGISGSWSCEFVDTASNKLGKYSSIAVGSDGNIHISGGNPLYYYTGTAGNWTLNAIENWGSYSSLAEVNGIGHITHLDYTNYNLRYCTAVVPEFFGVEFSWGELSGGLIAVLIVVAFSCLYSHKNLVLK
jgi:hypothetical protein